MNIKIYKLILLTVTIIGILTPYIDSFVIVQMFIFIIPFAIIFGISLLVLIYSVIKYKRNFYKQPSTKIISIVPLFLISQIFSVFILDNIQKLRSQRYINQIEAIKKSEKIYPKEFKTYLGIEYFKAENEDNFSLSYSRGFIVREVYSSSNKIWKSLGWND